MRQSRILFLSLFTLGWLLAIGPGRSGNISAQSASATLSGEVVDEQGAAIPGVNITALNVATSLRRRAVTNEAGGFTMPLLPPGVYTLVALRDGFTPIEIRQVELNINDNRALRIVLKVGAVTDSVIIVGTINSNGPTGTKNGAFSVSANRIDLSTATLKYTITNDQVSRAPAAARATGRNPLALLPFLAPGVSPTETTGTARGNNLDGAAMSVNGARPRSNSFSFQDGDNNEVETNSALSPLPNPDALQEITVLTNSYPADEGRGIGGVVNAVMKSGGADWHANLRYIGVNEAFAARSFFDRGKPVNRLHTFGGQVSGPAPLPGLLSGRDRTFFFFDYEGARWLQERTWTHLALLNDKERAGDFSSRPEISRPYDPLTDLPFPGGVIPPERINPISRALLEQFVPRLDNGRRLFSTTLPYRLVNNAVAVRADRHAGQSDSFNFTLFFNSPETVNSSEVLDIIKFPINFQSISRNRSWNAALGETHILSPRAVNQLTAAIARLSRVRKNSAPGLIGVAPRDFGFTGINPQSEKYLALPAIRTREFLIDPTHGEGESAYTTWQLKDDLSYDLGAHQIKTGGDLRRFALNLSEASNNGSFDFPDIAHFLLGLPDQFEQNTGSNMNLRQTSLYLYGLDNWRARSNLTFHLGLRYELALPLKDELSQAMVFRPGQQSLRIPYAPTGVLFTGDPDPIFGVVGRGIYPTDKNNLAPRIGLAYAPQGAAGWRRRLFGEGKTAIRAAWGVFYDAALGGAYARVGRNPPFSVSFSSSVEELAQRGGTFANPYGVAPNPFPLDSTRPVFDPFLYPTVTPFDPKFRTAYSYQYNLTIQRELPWELFLQLAYVGSNTFKQHRERELNLVRIDPDNLPDSIKDARIYPRLGSIWNQESTGRMRYDALQMSLERRFGNQFSFGVSYVLSKTFDDSSRAIDDPTPYPERWGRSDFDRRRNFVLYYLYDLPKPGKVGKLGGLLGGWQIGGVAQLRSGQPLHIFQEDDPLLRLANCCETVAGIPDLVAPFRRFDPRRVRTLMAPNSAPATGNFFFDPAAFSRASIADVFQARSGTLGRNIFDGPGIFQWDATLIKQIRLREKHVFEIRVDINNLLNHALFENPHTKIDDPEFGRVTSAGPGRMIQFSLRYGF